MQIQTLLAEGVGGEAVPREVGRGGGAEVAKSQIFDRTLSKVAEFITACKLYIRMRLRKGLVKGQVQWILSYVQGGAADVWKENIIEKLEAGEVEYETVEEFLATLKKEFGRGEEFKRAARGSRYKGRPLVEEFKKGMNRVIRRKLMEAENQPGSIEQ